MKKSFKLLSLAFLITCIISFSGCKKDQEEIPGVTTPAIITTDVTGITANSAVIESVVTKSGSSEVTSRGVCWSTARNPTVAGNKTSEDLNGTPAFSSKLIGLKPNTDYYVRAYATNGLGTSYGNEVLVTTSQVELANLTTSEVVSITVAGAFSGGTITSDGGAMITDQGVCWSTNPNPTVADNKTSKDFNSRTKFQSELNGLFPKTTYYVRAYAKNSAGIAYGNELSFTTSEISPIIFNPGLTYGSVSDIDGNSYKTIRIGTQVWMAENLKTTRYNNGTPIPNVTGDTEWKNLVGGGYCWYNNDPSNFKDTYGALYNWYAVIDNRKICPAGWKVPNSAEWKILASNLGGEGVAGGKMKETGTTHWLSPNGGATNESGFTGLPGGGRYTGTTNRFMTLGSSGTWWSSTSSYSGGLGADYFSTDSYSPVGYTSDDWQAFQSSGLSVRCLKE